MRFELLPLISYQEHPKELHSKQQGEELDVKDLSRLQPDACVLRMLLGAPIADPHLGLRYHQKSSFKEKHTLTRSVMVFKFPFNQ